VVETNKSEAQTFRLVVLETSKNDLHDIAKVWLQRGPMSESVTRRTI
jgi:methanogenic corrinoid protein MtbC1